jgi:hypothetical protein
VFAGRQPPRFSDTVLHALELLDAARAVRPTSSPTVR